MSQAELMFTRTAVLSFFSIWSAAKSGTSLRNVPTQHISTLALRSLFSVVVLAGIVVGFRTLPLTIFILIINTNSFTTALLQAYHLQIPVPTYEIVCMCGCYAGIVLISLYSREEETRSDGSTYTLLVGFIASLIAAVSISITSVTIYKLRELHFSVIQFWQAITTMCFFVCYWAYTLVQNRVWPYQPPPVVHNYWLYYVEIIAAVASSVFANTLMTISNANENPATVSLVSMCGIAYNFFFDKVFFLVEYNLGQYAGILLTIVFSVGSAGYRAVTAARKQK